MDSLYASYRKWRSSDLQQDGIIVGSDQTQEWLLPWWWSHYSRSNSYPVTFVDFGMTPGAREWCKERGELIRLLVADIFVASKEEIDPALIPAWENIYGKKLWNSRSAYFFKPMACLQSRYRRAIWIDLDCQILGNLAPLFPCCDRCGLTMTKEVGGTYTTGVIVFQHGLPIFEEWATQALFRNREFPGDQDLFTALLLENKTPIEILPDPYNWSRTFPENPNALVLHYHGDVGKAYIAYRIKLEALHEAL
ncbi:MAG: hypothetical protein JSS32_00925 [Verrucomicrobia bacterium]|nr:hypothetical protein [Verrucomicrobiota bacterium]